MAVIPTRTALYGLVALVTFTASVNCSPEQRLCFPESTTIVSCVNISSEWTREPSTDDCSTYLECLNGIGLQFCCARGQYFNPNTNECDQEANVDCDIVPTPGPETTTASQITTTTTTATGSTDTTTGGQETTTYDPSETTSTTADTSETTTTSSAPPATTTVAAETTTANPGPDLDALCASHASVPMVEVAYPGDCNRYIVCENGELSSVEMCPAGLHFNPFLSVCDSSDHAECLENVCRNVPEGELLEMASLNSCRNYFICVGNTTVVRSCAPGTIYDAGNGWCILDDAANPCQPERPPPPPASVIAQCVSGLELLKIPHPNLCNVYYQCLNGRLIVRQCPPGLVFDKILRQCNLEENAPCESITRIAV